MVSMNWSGTGKYESIAHSVCARYTCNADVIIENHMDALRECYPADASRTDANIALWRACLVSEGVDISS